MTDKTRWLGATRPLRSIAIVVGALVVLLTLTPLTTWWAHQLSGRLDPTQGDVLIVLAGSGTSDDGILGYSSYLRCEYSLRAWREGWVRAIVVSGGSPHGKPPAESIAEFLRANGVPAGVIATEAESLSTRDNAINTARLLKDRPGTKVLLTSDYHMFRARRAFEKAGIAVQPRPIPDVIKRSTSLLGRWPSFLDLCLETVKIVYYRMRGWI